MSDAPDDNFDRCTHCGAYADECQCDGGTGSATAAMRPTAAPTADDAERAREVANGLEACDWTNTPIGNKLIIKAAIQQLHACASQAAEVAALKGELLAVREVAQAYMAEMASCHPLTDIQTHLMDELAAALASTTTCAAAIEREWRAQSRADMLLEMDTIVAENYPRPVNPIEEMRRRDPTLPRAANATGETNGEG